MWLQQVLDQHRSSAPGAIALRDVRRDITWSRLHRDAHALAHTIAAHTTPGDRVIMLSTNCVEILATVFACALSATIAVPLNPALTDRELSAILNQVTPSYALADTSGLPRLEHLRPALPLLAINSVADLPDPPATTTAVGTLRGAGLTDPVMILHTSATTGSPKGVVCDQNYFQSQAASWQAEVGQDQRDTYLHTSPLCHGSITIALNYLCAGAPVTVLDQFTPHSFLTAVEQWQVRHTFLVPTMLRLLLDCRQLPGSDHTSLRLVTHGGAPCPPELAHQAGQALGSGMRTIFGITEGGGPVISLAPDDKPEAPAVAGATCAGRPMPGVTARITTTDGCPAHPYQAGTLHLKSAGLMRSYWNNPQATTQTVIDGWLNTGDFGYQDADGRIWILNRRSDLILRGGQNVYPAEIEHVLRTLEWVTEAAVVPAPCDTSGQTPVAFIQPTATDDFDERELIAHCIRNLAGYKRPTRFIPIQTLPRNTVGKLLRRPLEQHAADLACTNEPGRPS
ncbi:class I adenylate-forming enzyme family protein [Streptomyces sp. NPDC060028]|uniref:class I adenylate-forming enzyme family protein n=1 Tax=Streptomyces sp. NPDC060028 TaxID=3347041 RepID=UPI0036CA8A42